MTITSAETGFHLDKDSKVEARFSAYDIGKSTEFHTLNIKCDNSRFVMYLKSVDQTQQFFLEVIRAYQEWREKIIANQDILV